MKKAGVNRRQISRTISKGLQSRFKKDITLKVRADVARAKAMMLAEFRAHPVTKEIEAGPSSANISGTLGGIGNLFSFIGFDRGDNPVKPVQRILETSTRLNSVRRLPGDKLGFEVIIDVPSKEDVSSASPLPWAAARSWVMGIEQGLSGFGTFLVKPGEGRSGGGIQVSGVIRAGGFKNKKYVSAILAGLQSNLMKFLRQ